MIFNYSNHIIDTSKEKITQKSKYYEKKFFRDFHAEIFGKSKSISVSYFIDKLSDEYNYSWIFNTEKIR